MNADKVALAQLSSAQLSSAQLNSTQTKQDRILFLREVPVPVPNMTLLSEGHGTTSQQDDNQGGKKLYLSSVSLTTWQKSIIQHHYHFPTLPEAFSLQKATRQYSTGGYFKTLKHILSLRAGILYRYVVSLRRKSVGLQNNRVAMQIFSNCVQEVFVNMKESISVFSTLQTLCGNIFNKQVYKILLKFSEKLCNIICLSHYLSFISKILIT